MAYKELVELAYGLYKRTNSGKINWGETVEEDVYQASLANYSVRISLEDSETTAPNDVRITIINSEGSVIESFTDVDLRDEWHGNLEIDESPYVIMLNMYEIARRTALGSEKAIRDILKELDDDEIAS